MKIYLPCLARMLFYRARRAAGLAGLGWQNLFPLPLPFPLDLADGCGVMPVGTPKPVAAERLQTRFADKNDNAGLSQALFDFTAPNGWEPYDCLALCICLFNEQERMKREFELA